MSDRRRQEALGLDTGGDELTPDELAFLERYQALEPGTPLCAKVRWIPRDRVRYRPTNDFVWLDQGGIEVELKCTRPRYPTIRNQICDSVRRARDQDVRKAYFVVDLGDRRPTDTLRRQLGRYNANNPANTIAALWLMSRNGLERVRLVEDEQGVEPARSSGLLSQG